jgi:hypothetical protein
MRHFDWENRLEVELEAARARVFEWGQHDCCQFAMRVIAATRMDMPNFTAPGCYRNRQEALRLLRRITGKKTAREAMASLPEVFGFKPTPVTFAARGDMVLIPMRPMPALGVVTLDARYAVAPGPDDLVRVLTLSCSRAWRL